MGRSELNGRETGVKSVSGQRTNLVQQESLNKLIEDGLLEGKDGGDDKEEELQDKQLQIVVDQEPEGTFNMPRLSDEVLKMILSHLTLLDDLRAAVNSHKEWRRILRPKRQLWLFPNVLPFLTKYLRRKDILQLRSVCSQWRQGVDEFIENAEHLAPYSPSRSLLRHRHPAERVPVWKQTDIKFPYRIGYPSSRRFQNGQFDWEMITHPLNPIVGRELSIGMLPSASCESCHPESPLIYGGVRTFLSIFGHHIYYLNLEFPKGFNFWKMHLMLKAILGKTPNLRQLRLAGDEPQACVHYQSLDVDEILFGALVGYSAFPGLKTLQLEFTVNGPVTLFPVDDILLLKHSAGLGRLEVKRWNPSWSGLDWRSLTDLSLPVHGSNVLRSLVQLDAPKLARLCLTFPGDDTDTEGRSELFQVLQHFPALESLGILFERTTTPIHEMREKGTIFWLEFEEVLSRNQTNFPLVKILELRNAPIPLELILHFPNVQVVNVIGTVDVEPDRFTVCDFSYDSKPWEYGNSQTGMVGIDEMGEHDPDFYETRVEDDDDQLLPSVWLQLPRLQVLTVGGRIHRRERFGKFAQRFQRLAICDFPTLFSSLLQLSLPKVTQVKLQLGYGYHQQPVGDQHQNVFNRKLLKVLANLPNLAKLELTCMNFAASANLERGGSQSRSKNRDDKIGNDQIMFPSVIFLKVNFLPIPKGFLLRFPSLKWLQFDPVIGQRTYCKKWTDPILFRKYKPGSYKLQTDLPTSKSYKLKEIPESEVWNLIPSLELFTVNGAKGSAHYSRGGGFEYIQKE